MLAFIRVFLSRVLAPLIASFAAWVAVRFGVDIDAANQQQLIESIIVWVLTIFTVVYGIAHKLIDRKLNPGDAASTTLAESEKDEHETLSGFAAREKGGG